MESTHAIYLYGKEDIRVHPCERIELQADHVLVNIKSVGICGTDIHYYGHGNMSAVRATNENPLSIGHEASGVVCGVGKDVSTLVNGDRIALAALCPCGLPTCEYCSNYRSNLCPISHFVLNAQAKDRGEVVEEEEDHIGFMRSFVPIPAKFCHKVPDSMTFDYAALLEPLAVACNIVNRAGITRTSKDRVLVIGGGTMGLCTMLAVKARADIDVGVIEKAPNRVELAKELGASAAFSADVSDEVAFKQAVESNFPNPSIVVDCTGDGRVLGLAVTVVKCAGVVVMVGVVHEEIVPFPSFLATIKEIDVRGVFCCDGNNVEEAISLFEAGQAPLSRLISHNFSIEETSIAFETALDRCTSCVKVVINP